MLLGVVSSGAIFWMVVISKWCVKRSFLLKFSVWRSTDTLFQHIDNKGNRCNCQFAYSEEKGKSQDNETICLMMWFREFFKKQLTFFSFLPITITFSHILALEIVLSLFCCNVFVLSLHQGQCCNAAKGCPLQWLFCLRSCTAACPN